MLKKYNMTQDDYEELLLKQNNSCAICGISSKDYKESLHVDHCHNTGIVRGLLCFKCNTVLGKVNDDVGILQKAIKYIYKTTLRSAKQRKVEMNANNQKNEYKGYSLFNDVEDEILRNRNRAVIMSNILEHNTKNKRVSPKGAGLVLGYFNSIPPEERKAVNDLFELRIKEMGFVRQAA